MISRSKADMYLYMLIGISILSAVNLCLLIALFHKIRTCARNSKGGEQSAVEYHCPAFPDRGFAESADNENYYDEVNILK